MRANITNRIEVIDALRGFALMGIAFRHFITRFDYGNGVYSRNPLLAKIDKFTEVADYHFLADKTYPIFALLFGFSMFLVNQSGSAAYSSERSFKRILALIPFACLNALFFPDGDVLGLYVVTGLITLLLIKLPVKWWPRLAAFFLLQPAIWIQIIINLFNGNVNIIDHSSSLLFRDINYNYTIGCGHFLKVMWINLTEGQLDNLLWAFDVGRVSQTIGLMLLGYYLGESGLFLKFIGKGKKCLPYVLIPVLMIAGGMLLKRVVTGTVVSKELLLIISIWSGLAFAVAYIILIIFIYNIFPSNSFSPLSYYGRMSLTNYILQSVIGAILFAPFAFNGVAYLPNVLIVPLFAITIFVQVIFSKYWLGVNRYGPLEFYWRSFSLQLTKKKYELLICFINIKIFIL
ncbi:MAG: DUF418 domain-containing protein [Niabella sp.]